MINLIQILVINIDCNNILWIFLVLKNSYTLYNSSILHFLLVCKFYIGTSNLFWSHIILKSENSFDP
jgi:hypothetical protein